MNKKNVSPAKRALSSSRAKGLSTTRALSVHVPDDLIETSVSCIVLTFCDLVALFVRLRFDDVTLYQTLHDLLQPE